MIRNIIGAPAYSKLILLKAAVKNYRNFHTDFFLNQKTYVMNKSNKPLFSIRDLGDSTASRALSFYTKEPGTVEWIDSFLPDSCFLDIGANIGIYSLYAATHKHNVISVEPEFSNFFMLNANIRDNNLASKITAYPISMYNKSKIANLHIRYGTLGASSNSFETPIGQTGELFNPVYKQGSISLTTDELLSNLNLQANYIKIDVDGHELCVIEGMIETLKHQSLQSISIELNIELSDHERALAIIESNGFNLLSEDRLDDHHANYILNRY
tara:strand:+ start:434 stop:1243 length:810 start_codon:yes stop_codon:yes gene_type:complete